MPEKTALIITPFDAGAAHVTDTLKRALSDAGFLPVTIDRLVIPGALVGETILDALQRADLIIADVSRHSPNVMYELGFAHALRKPTIMITSRQAAARLPADLAGYLYVSYDESNLTSLRDDVARIAAGITGTATGGDKQ